MTHVDQTPLTAEMLLDGFDPAVSLWRDSGPGHTRAVQGCAVVHSGRHSAGRLLSAALAGGFDQMPVREVLRALGDLIVDEGRFRGCMRWYAEETEIADSNAAFFVGINLCALATLIPDTPERREVLSILRRMRPWFEHICEGEDWWYPNKFLGDLACAWMIAELTDDGDAIERFAQPVGDGCRRLHRSGWGWGEHLSDVYGELCLEIVGFVLVAARRMPVEVREIWTQAGADLLQIDDAFADGPRVPTVRSYKAAICPPAGRSFRARIAAAAVHPDPGCHAPIAWVLHHLGWERLVMARPDASEAVRVPCAHGAAAHACVRTDRRLGGLSQWPYYPGSEHGSWGLSWQTMPAALWHRDGWWAMLQWVVEGPLGLRRHPAEAYNGAVGGYLAPSLTTTVQPPLVGRTWCIVRGGSLIVLRVMPAVPDEWATASDGVRLNVPVSQAFRACDGPGFAQLELPATGGPLALLHLPLAGDPFAQATQRGSIWHWGSSTGPLAGRNRRCLAALWGMRLDGPVQSMPRVTLLPLLGHRSADERPVAVDWDWGDVHWRLEVDVLSQRPLREI